MTYSPKDTVTSFNVSHAAEQDFSKIRWSFWTKIIPYLQCIELKVTFEEVWPAHTSEDLCTIRILPKPKASKHLPHSIQIKWVSVAIAGFSFSFSFCFCKPTPLNTQYLYHKVIFMLFTHTHPPPHSLSFRLVFPTLSIFVFPLPLGWVVSFPVL